MPENDTQNIQKSGGRFDLNDIATAFPEDATTMLVDRYVTDNAQRSIRVFRVYKGVPAHYHTQCDEILHVLSGTGTFWIDDPSDEAEFKPGHLLVFPKGAIHALPRILRGPVVFLAIDAPRRAPDDITFVDDRHHDVSDFIRGV